MKAKLIKGGALAVGLLAALAAGGCNRDRVAEDVSDLKIRRDLHACQGDESDARVVDLAAGEHFTQFLADLIPDTIRTEALGHKFTGSRNRDPAVVHSSTFWFLGSRSRSLPRAEYRTEHEQEPSTENARSVHDWIFLTPLPLRAPS